MFYPRFLSARRTLLRHELGIRGAGSLKASAVASATCSLTVVSDGLCGEPPLELQPQVLILTLLNSASIHPRRMHQTFERKDLAAGRMAETRPGSGSGSTGAAVGATASSLKWNGTWHEMWSRDSENLSGDLMRAGLNDARARRSGVGLACRLLMFIAARHEVKGYTVCVSHMGYE